MVGQLTTSLCIPELERAKTDPRARLKRVNAETAEALKELDATYKAPEKKEDVSVKADKFNAAPFSMGKVRLDGHNSFSYKIKHSLTNEITLGRRIVHVHRDAKN